MVRYLVFFIVFFVWGGVAYAAPPASTKIDVYYPDEILCAVPTDFVKCARLPMITYVNNTINSSVYAHITDGTEVDDINWTHFRNGVPIVGRAENVKVEEYSSGGIHLYKVFTDCVVTSPFVTTFEANSIYATSLQSGARTCIKSAKTAEATQIPDESALKVAAIALEGDSCPDGFFTVPYESWCGDGMVNIADVPSCDEDISGEYCLMSVLKPCASGISRLRASNGVSVPLFAEKSTLPSLAVKYNGITCFANFEPGTADGTLNVVFDGQVYHAQTE